MRLKSIKLAGFKSFVDPTTLPLRNNLVGIVGPNGCGKSNIVDALRWVLGESSARQLRGDALVDVIFSGSTGRKPVGQASVELIFDNSEGKLAGNYGQYAEISVRRQASRDGQSNYYLNGTRCRRRDVTDLFLGTGLGPRSYAIIEQGMITRLIEARPDELRVFVEEAAGISRYKERRRETENRIRHTRENMERVADLQDELEKRLVTLKRQANAAERFKELKAQQRDLSGRLLVLGFADLSARRSDQQQLIEVAGNDLEQQRAAQAHSEKELEQLRQLQQNRSEELNQVQQRYYEGGAEIARLEQSVASLNAALKRDSEEQARLAEQSRELERHLHEDSERQELLNTQLQALQQQLKQSEKELAGARQQKHDADQALSDQRDSLKAVDSDQRDSARRCEQLTGRIASLKKRQQQLAGSQKHLQERITELANEDFDQEIRQLRELIETTAGQLDTVKSARETVEEGMQKRQQKRAELAQELDHQRTELQVLRGSHASLLALQQQQLHGEESGRRWLQKQGLESTAQLIEMLTVEAGWEHAVEALLGNRIGARLVASLDTTAGSIDADTSALVLVEERAADSTRNNPLSPKLVQSGASLLFSRVSSSVDFSSLFGDALAVDQLADALNLRDQLRKGQVAVTRNGTVVGQNWLDLPAAGDGAGLLERAAELELLDRKIAEQQLLVQKTQQALQEVETRIAASDAERQRIQQEFQQLQAQQLEQESRLGGLVERQRINGQERLRVATERDQLDQLAKQEEQELVDAQTDLAAAEHQRQSAARLLQPQQQVLAERQQQVARADEQFSRVSARDQGLRRDQQRMELETEQIQRGERRWRDQLESTRQALETVEQRIAQGQQPIIDVENQLQEALNRQQSNTQNLNQARSAMEGLQAQLRKADERFHLAQQKVQQSRDKLEAERLKEQELRVREAALQEQAERDGFDLFKLLPELDESWDEQGLTRQREQLERRITQLGAINLAAIDEYEQVAERKGYLDSQQADLEEALQTMAEVIGRIDRETRGRFRATFDKINGGLQNLFPQLFGGGAARLELVGDDLLDAGVSIIAQPPGKRNSSIHLLSGGEKALTAIAMVFSIFQLNPSPFCVLDEVDAPLDDANVDRFSEMVRKMSDQVQFLLVTHNKVTMEMTQQLSGVTMGEPGVSRLVAVDLDEAARLVDA